MFERYIETEDFLHIPMSSKLYRINTEGIIIHDNGKLTGQRLETFTNSEGSLVVKLDLWRGITEYLVAELIAHTFKPIHVAVKYWPMLKIMYHDLDKRNIHPSNLVWKFPIGLESIKYPGYAYIPGFSKYVISKEGKVIQHLTGRKSLGTIVNKYIRFNLLPDIGKSISVGRHRLLCLAWLDYPHNTDDLHVNHINGIPGSDDLSNLEWITPKGNVYHALRNKLRIDGREILARNIETGVITSYYTEAEACRALDLRRGSIRLNTDMPLGKRKAYRGYEFRLARDGVFWDGANLTEYIDVINSSEGKVGREDNYSLGLRVDNKKVLVKNVKTNVITEYISHAECARNLGISCKLVDLRLSTKNQLVFPGYLQFKHKDDLTPWRDVLDPEVELDDGRFPKPVLVRNVKTNEIKEYASISDCGVDYGLTPSGVFVRIKPNQKLFPGYLQFKYKNDLTPWRDPTDIEEEERQAHLDQFKESYPILVRNLVDGSITEYSSINSFHKETGLTVRFSGKRLSLKNHPVLPGYLQIKSKDDLTPWREVINADDEISNGICIKSRNIFTGEVLKHETITQAGEVLGLDRKMIRRYLKSDDRKHPLRQWDFKYITDDRDWPVYSDRDLVFYNSCKNDNDVFCDRGYVVKDITNGEESFFGTRSSILKRFGITIAKLVYLIKQQYIFQNKYLFTYYFKY